MQRIVQPHVRADRCTFGGGARDAQAQARRPAAVSHALPQIEGQDFPNRPVRSNEPRQIGADRRILGAFGRRDQQHASIGTRQ
jgi:hypothetical protein